MYTVVIYFVVALVALVEAVLFWLGDMFLFRQMLKGKIDSLTYLNPVPAMMMFLLAGFPPMLILHLMGGNYAAENMKGLWGLPAFIAWAFILKKPMIAWRERISQTIELTQEQREELGMTSAFANYINSGGIR